MRVVDALGCVMSACVARFLNDFWKKLEVNSDGFWAQHADVVLKTSYRFKQLGVLLDCM